MISIPVRIELQVGRDGPTCSMTIPSVPLMSCPSNGDFVLFTKDTEEPFAVSVQAAAHYDDESTMILTQTVVCASYDDMLVKFDWFKDRYEIEDFRASETPESYYILYRTIVHLLDISSDAPVVIYDPDIIKVLAETCRTVWLANMFSIGENGRLPLRSDISTKITETNGDIEAFHRLVFGYRGQFPSGVGLRQIAKDWDTRVNKDGKYNWDVDDDLCQFVGKIVFSRLKCAAPHFLKVEQ